MPRPSPENRTAALVDVAWSADGGFSTTDRTYVYSHREHNSHSTPGYALLRRLKLLPDNGYTMMRYTIATGQWYGAHYHWLDGRLLSWSRNSVWHSCGSLPFTLRPGNMDTDANNKAFLRLAKQASSVQVNLAQFFGERKQTADMLVATVERVSQAALALKRADLKAFTRSLGLSGTESRRASLNWKSVVETPVWKRIPSFWLEYVYGWRPLLSDVAASAEMLAKMVVRTENPVNFGTLKSSATVTQSVAPTDSGGGALSHVVYGVRSVHTVSVRCSATYELENEAKSVLAQTGISNPLLLAWELLPYSFVVDWFIPVGNYLESLTAFDGFAFSRSTVSMKESSTMVAEASYYKAPNDDSRDTFVGGDCSAVQFRYTFTPNGMPHYVPFLRSPIGGEPLERFATAMSLLTNLFRPGARKLGS